MYLNKRPIVSFITYNFKCTVKNISTFFFEVRTLFNKYILS